MAFAINRDRVKSLPVKEVEMPEEYYDLFIDEHVIGCYKAIRDLIIFTDIRIVSIDVQGLTGKQKVIVTIPYTHICEMTIETSGYLDIDTDLILRTTAGTAMAYSFRRGRDVIKIQSYIAHKMQ